MISDDRLERLAETGLRPSRDDTQSMANELLALRKALSEPVGLFTECRSMGYSHFVQTTVGEPLYRKPE